VSVLSEQARATASVVAAAAKRYRLRMGVLLRNESPARVAGGRFIVSPAVVPADIDRETRGFADRPHDRGAVS